MNSYKIEWQDVVTKSLVVEAESEEEVRTLFKIGAYSEEPAIIQNHKPNLEYKEQDYGLLVEEN